MDFHDRRNDVQTDYHPDTDPRVKSIIDSHLAARNSGQGVRLKVHYGDPKTGQPHGDVDSGYVGRSTGMQRVPLIINNSRSQGGSPISTHQVVKIESTRKTRSGRPEVLYQHPKYQP